MKVIFNRMRWLSLGIYLGAFIVLWFQDDEQKTNKKLNEPSDEFMNIYNHYNTKETTNA